MALTKEQRLLRPLVIKKLANQVRNYRISGLRNDNAISISYFRFNSESPILDISFTEKESIFFEVVVKENERIAEVTALFNCLSSELPFNPLLLELSDKILKDYAK